MNEIFGRQLCVITAVLCAALVGAAQPTTRPAHRSTPAVACLFTPDGSIVIAARHDQILLLSSDDGALQSYMKPDLRRITSLASSWDGRLLAVGGGDPGVSGTVLLIDPKSGRVIATAGGFTDLVTSVTFSPDGKTVAAASADRTVRLFGLRDTPASIEPLARLEGHAGPVLAVAFNRLGTTLVTASADRSIKVWDVPGGKVRRTLTNHTGAVYALAPMLTDPTDLVPFTCASCADDRTVRIWQPDIGRMVRIVRNHDGPVFAVAYSPDSSALFSAGSEGIVRMIDPNSDSVLRQWRASDDWIYALAVSPDNKSLVTTDWGGT